MDWEEDPFESIVRDFFRESGQRRQESLADKEPEERGIDIVEIGETVFMVFDLPGFEAKDMSVSLKDRRIEVVAKKKGASNIQEYLLPRLQRGTFVRKTIPSSVHTREFHHTYKNGMLEVYFKK